MKRILSFAAVAAAAAMALSSCTDRSQTLKVYNWSNYIAEGVIDDFEDWYFQQTGEKIKVIYQTFDINETMLSKIEIGKEDFDVVCPSDYIIERMLGSDMLLPLDFTSLPDSINYIRNNQSPYMKKIFSEIHPTKDANQYSVPFMWGTTGILYNADMVTAEEASTWGCLANPKFAGKVLLKDAPRDVFAPVLIYINRDRLAAGEVTLEQLMRDSSDESVAAVKDFLMEVVNNGVYGFEADFGKEDMTKDRACVSLNWSGDAVWAIEEGASVGVNLAYAVPEVGSTIWFDGWVIPKYAVNTKAATYFIDFMCRPDIAIRNMEETGYIAANGALEVLESQIDEECEPIDLSYFFGETADSVRVSQDQYPDASVIARCVLEHDWGTDTEKLLNMWQEIKGSAN